MFKVIIWPSKTKVPVWQKSHKGGYEAGDLVQWDYHEYVCINTHRNPVFPPDKGSLWAEVVR
jgi:hypothetical protein